MATKEVYNDGAVFLPGRGAVLTGDVGADMPSIETVKQWISGGATGELTEGDSTMYPLGYTSIDELPNIGADIEGGEVKGVWENAQLRTTRQVVTESIVVQPVQWSRTPLTHRFGPGTIRNDEGVFEVPAVYTATEVSLTIIFIDGTEPLIFHIPKTATAPEGGIEPSADDFMSLPVKYTVLTMTGRPKMYIAHAGLIDTDGDGEPDAVDPTDGRPAGDTGNDIVDGV